MSVANPLDPQLPVRQERTVQRVLVVEDERIVAADLQLMLNELGYDAYAQAASGAEALARAGEMRPDVALMDIRIKGPLDGVETARQLQRACGAGIIFLTAHADDQTIQRAAELGPCGYLLKPVTAAALKAAIELSYARRVRDLAQQREQQALARDHLQLAHVVGHLSLAALMEDTSGRVQYVNPAYCALFGVDADPSGLIGTEVALLHERVRDACAESSHILARIQGVRRSRQPVAGETVSLRDGRTLERDYMPVREGVLCIGHVWSYRDVTLRERDRQAAEATAARNRALVLNDELTGLHSRRGFNVVAESFLRLMRRSGEIKVLFYFDLNGLKQINDRLGHAVGDRAICDMAELLKLSFRQSDLLARLGGDEFVVLASLVTGEADLVRGRLLRRLEQFNQDGSRPYRLASSIGLAEYRTGESVEALLARADQAMYSDKARYAKLDAKLQLL